MHIKVEITVRMGAKGKLKKLGFMHLPKFRNCLLTIRIQGD